MKNSPPRALSLLLAALLLFSLSSCFLLQPVDNTPEVVYGKLLTEYAHLLTVHSEGNDLSAVEAPTAKGLSDELFDSLKTLIPETEYEDLTDMGYAFYDLDGDGTHECFLMKRDGTLYALYACQNGAPYLVEAYRGGASRQGVLMEDGTVYTMHVFKEDDKLVSSEYRYSRFENGEMIPYRSYVIDYANDTAYAVENGEKRDFSKVENMDLNEQVADFQYSYKLHAKEAGLWFKSVNTLTDGNAGTDTASPGTTDKPVFDASSYDAILDSLTAMMPLIRAYSYSEWLNGEYDDRMAVDSPETFRVYSNLLYACGAHGGYKDVDGTRHDKAIGYAYRDMNADGSDELFILNEDSDLMALFTLRDGTPVLLWRANDGSFTAMDSEGHLMFSHYTNRALTAIEYFSYELNPEGELAPVAYLYGAEYVCRILTTDGKVTVVDHDTYRAEFKRVFDKNQGEIWDGTWNEGGEMLKFTALPEN